MKRIVMLGCLAAMASGVAGARSCEDNFRADGDPRNGAIFSTSVTIPGLGMRSALGQMQKIALDDGFQIGNEELGEREGKLTIVQKSSMLNRGFLIHITADADGKVGIDTRLNRGQQAKAEDIRGSMCKMLARLKTGADADAIAAATRAKTGVDKVINIKARDLAVELGRLKTSSEDPRAIGARYLNKVYRIDGQVRWKSDPDATPLTMDFKTVLESGMLGVPEEVLNERPMIICVMAPDQGDFFDSLEPEDYATVIGKVAKYEGSAITLENCRRD